MKVWDGVYSDWDTAVRVAEDGSTAVFDSDRWLKKVVAQLEDYRSELHTRGIALPPRPTNLPLLAALTDPASIIDFGGSSGWCWDHLRAVVPSTDVSRYEVLETDSLVSYFETSGHHGPPVRYRSDASDIEGCDILYTNSVLQYFPTNAPLLQLITDSSPTYVLLDDLFAGDIPEYFSVQNYYDQKIPCRFINFDLLDEDLRKLGYALVSKEPFDTPTLGASQPKPMDNFEVSHRLRYSLSALYRRTG